VSVLTLHSMLLVGPYDWDAAALPREEFADRLAAFWQRMPAHCAGLIVYGDSRSHAELMYLTHFVPKVRQAMAFVPRTGDPLVLIPGSRAQFPTMKRLTWTENIELLSDPGKAVTDWLGALGVDGSRIAIAGTDVMRPAARQAVLQALGAEPFDATAVVASVMARKRPRELDALRGACALLDAARAALTGACERGETVTAAVLAAEHAAHKQGAQDVRSLFSVDGGRTLVPFSTPLPERADPLQCYMAVRHRGYWADGFLVAGNSAAVTAARKALAHIAHACRPGANAGELAAQADTALKPYARHPVTASQFGNAIGLSLDEPPLLRTGGDASLEPGGVYSLRLGSAAANEYGFASAMVSVQDSGPRILWSS
jgi:Xaa-Pro aminopeptidase